MFASRSRGRKVGSARIIGAHFSEQVRGQTSQNGDQARGQALRRPHAAGHKPGSPVEFGMGCALDHHLRISFSKRSSDVGDPGTMPREGATTAMRSRSGIEWRLDGHPQRVAHEPRYRLHTVFRGFEMNRDIMKMNTIVRTRNQGETMYSI